MMLTCAGKTLWGVCQGGNRLGKQAEILADLRKLVAQNGTRQNSPSQVSIAKSADFMWSVFGNFTLAHHDELIEPPANTS